MLPDFELHDVSEFPLVRFQASQTYRGCADVWCAEMDLLVSGEAPFVLIYLPASQEEDHDDRKMRGIWLKSNKDAMAGKCVALIVVEPDLTKRSQLESLSPNLVKAFGTPQMVRATQAEAESLGRDMLAAV